MYLETQLNRQMLLDFIALAEEVNLSSEDAVQILRTVFLTGESPLTVYKKLKKHSGD